MSEFFRALERAEHARRKAVVASAARDYTPLLPPGTEPDAGTPAALRGRRWRIRRRPEPSAHDGAGDRPFRDLDPKLVSMRAPRSPLADEYRALRHFVESRRQPDRGTVIAVTSAGDGEGKSLVAMNLAGALAQSREARVLFVDASLRGTGCTHLLGLPEPGDRTLRAGVANRAAGLDNIVWSCGRFNLTVLPGGGPVATPYDVLGSPRFAELLEQARREYDAVVIDTPPLPLPECRVVGDLSDGFLVVVAAHRTTRRHLAEALQRVHPERVLGFVFNDGVPRSASGGDHRTGGGRR